MTTVGYGDMYPISPLGKVIAGFTMLFGILLIALPMAIVGNKFQEVYDEQNKNPIKSGKTTHLALIGDATRRHMDFERDEDGQVEDPRTLVEALQECVLLHDELKSSLTLAA